MVLALFEFAWNDALLVLVPLIAAVIGGLIGAGAARRLRRHDMHGRAAEKVNGYIDEAFKLLTGIDRQAPFDADALSRAQREVGFARFHSKRLESEEVTNRLGVTRMVLHDIVSEKGYDGLDHAFQSIDDVMQAVVEFMILPRLWPPSWLLRRDRELPLNGFPNTFGEYRKLVPTPHPGTMKIDWTELQLWTGERELEVRRQLGLE